MAVRLNKIYTRSGDRGETRVVGGSKVSKASSLVESYGTVDELNSQIGLIRSLAREFPLLSEETEALFKVIQNTLFDIGSLLATMPDDAELPARLDAFKRPTDDGNDEHILMLEQKIDEWNQDLPELDSFVLPGGAVINAHANVARTICRRLERILVQRSPEYPVDPVIMAYINRLSDFLFVYSRWVSKTLGEPEILWEMNQ